MTLKPTYLSSVINGKPCETDITFNTENPATEEVICELSSADESLVDLAVKSAKEAFENTWGKFSLGRRQKILENLADLISENKQELVELESIENGVPVTVVDKFSVAALQKNISYCASWIDKLSGQVIPITSSNAFDFSLREPFGVVAAVIAYNTPSLFLGSKVGAALATGNTVVIKPSPLASFPALKFVELAQIAGIPEGTVNVVLGDQNVSKALVGHKLVDLISFTGSKQAGKQVRALGNENLTPTILELGGKSPNIVFEDANLSKVPFSSALGAFALTGQACVAGSRIYVQEGIFEEVLDKLTSMTKLLKVGNPSDKQTVLGPLISKDHLNRVKTLVDVAISEGGIVALGGDSPTDILPKGYYFNPTVVTNMTEESYLVKEEIFGPVVVVQRFKDEDEVIKKANDTAYGLGAAVWTQDISRAFRVSKSLRSGTVWINSYGIVPHTAPFGGYKQSGHGREGGKYGLEMYQQTKNVYIDLAQ